MIFYRRNSLFRFKKKRKKKIRLIKKKDEGIIMFADHNITCRGQLQLEWGIAWRVVKSIRAGCWFASFVVAITPDARVHLCISMCQVQIDSLIQGKRDLKAVFLGRSIRARAKRIDFVHSIVTVLVGDVRDFAPLFKSQFTELYDEGTPLFPFLFSFISISIFAFPFF